ncbi:hypothetical protein KA025_03520 [Candidatus Saccharibacteria bacterium]|nr:hypothetical protein [Candidatus Saccharibacteria bacterium]
MNENDKTLNEIINFLDRQPGSRPKVIAEDLGVTRQYIQRLLASNKDKFSVSGSGPNRFYRNKEALKNNDTETIDMDNPNDIKLIENNFYSLTPLGEELIGIDGFVKWCNARKLNVSTMKKEYISVLLKYYGANFKTPLDFTNKLSTTLKDNSLTKVWSVDYYNFEIFGKTKLGTQVMIAKQTGDKETIASLVKILDPVVNTIIKKYDIDAIAFTPPTIQRQYQLMGMLDNGLRVNLPRVKIYKVGAKILIAQKTLKSLEDRILNASQTFIVESANQYSNVLIIDDALGSGATLNEISKQIIQKNIAKTCYGLVLVASPSGYEVINEV